MKYFNTVIIMLFLLILNSCDEGVTQPKLITVDYEEELRNKKSSFITGSDMTQSDQLDFLASTYAQFLCSDTINQIHPIMVINHLNQLSPPGYKLQSFIISFDLSEKVKSGDKILLENTKIYAYYVIYEEGVVFRKEYGLGWGEENDNFCVGGLIVNWGK